MAMSTRVPPLDSRTVRAMGPLIVIALAVFAHALVSERISTTIITAPMVFVAVGLLTGPEVFGLAAIDLRSEEVIVLAEMTLAIVLFSDAVRIDPRRARRFVRVPARLLGIGLPLVMAASTVIARFALDIDWPEAALVGAILTGTDAALGQAVLTDESVPGRIRGSLNIESGLNDGLALPAVALFTAVAATATDSEPISYWLRYLAEQVGYGTLIGVAVGSGCGWALTRARRRGWVAGIEGQLATFSQVGLAFALAHAAGGNTFIAAFMAGVAFRFVGKDDAEYLAEFTEDSGQLLASITFVVFGNALLGPTLGLLTVPIALSVIGFLTIARMLPVAVSLAGSGLRAPTVVFLGWFGPRGLASILFAVTVLAETGRTVDDTVFVVVAWTVLASIILHGSTASWGARRYGEWCAAHERVMHPEATAEGPMEPDEAMMRPRWAPRTDRDGDGVSERSR